MAFIFRLFTRLAKSATILHFKDDHNTTVCVSSLLSVLLIRCLIAESFTDKKVVALFDHAGPEVRFFIFSRLRMKVNAIKPNNKIKIFNVYFLLRTKV